MGFGILEPSQANRPQGTVLLEGLHEGKRGKSAEVILVPQPGISPQDPLNWSRVRKELAFATIVFGCCAAGVIGPLLVPGFSIVALDLDVSLTHVTLLNGSLVMALGVSAYFCNALATVYGTRLIFLLTTVFLVATCCWGAAAKSYNSLLAARVFQGFGMGSWFALAGTTSINDMFFVHERGRRVGLWNFAVIVSVNIAPVISARVIVNLSWRWAFWLLAITFGVALVLTIFLFPETSFRRAHSFGADDLDITENINTDPHNRLPASMEKPGLAEPISLDIAHGSVSGTAPAWKKFLGIDAAPTGTLTQALKALVSPLSLLRHPAVIWGCLMWAVTFTWVIIQGAIADQVWQAPPYNLSATAVGNIVGIAPLIGSALGCLIGGALCDWIGQAIAKRNGGIYEPEFRLWIILPTLIAMIIGIFGLAEAIERGMGVIVTAVFLAILNFAVGVGCTGIVSYTNDTCQKRAGEAFGLAMVVKSAFAFGLSFMLNDYYAEKGPRIFFATWGGLTVGITLLTIPMYIWGKKIRAWSEKHSIV